MSDTDLLVLLSVLLAVVAVAVVAVALIRIRAGLESASNNLATLGDALETVESEHLRPLEPAVKAINAQFDVIVGPPNACGSFEYAGNVKSKRLSLPPGANLTLAYISAGKGSLPNPREIASGEFMKDVSSCWSAGFLISSPAAARLEYGTGFAAQGLSVAADHQTPTFPM